MLITDLTINEKYFTEKNIEYVDLNLKNIGNCKGCFGCWTKTPGKCVIRDDATKIYTDIAKTDFIIYVSKVVFGCYDTPVKNLMERSLPVQKAFIRMHEGETHHFQRDVIPKKAFIIAYGAESDLEKEIFKKLVERNSKNMSFISYDIIFTTEKEAENIAKKVVEQQWKK